MIEPSAPALDRGGSSPDLGPVRRSFRVSKGRRQLGYVITTASCVITFALLTPVVVFAFLLLLFSAAQGVPVEAIGFGSIGLGVVLGVAVGIWWQRRHDRGVPDSIDILEGGVRWSSGADSIPEPGQVSWSDVRSIRMKRQRMDMGTAVGTVKGRVVSQYWVSTSAGDWQVNNSYGDTDEVGDALFAGTQHLVVDRALQELAAGGAVEFGPIALGANGIMVFDKAFALADVAEVRLENGLFMLKASPRGQATAGIDRISNLPALLTLLDNRHVLGQLATSASQAPAEVGGSG